MIRVHYSSESELGIYFAEGLEHAGLNRAASILSAAADDEAGLLKVTVALSRVADWKLRSQVHQVAMRVEDEHDVTVLCYFRPLDPVPFAPKHARADLPQVVGTRVPTIWAIDPQDTDDGPRPHALKSQPVVRPTVIRVRGFPPRPAVACRRWSAWLRCCSVRVATQFDDSKQEADMLSSPIVGRPGPEFGPSR